MLPKKVIQDPSGSVQCQLGTVFGCGGWGCGREGGACGNRAGPSADARGIPAGQAPSQSRGVGDGERLPLSLGGTTGGWGGWGCPRCQTSFSALMFLAQQACGVSYHTGLTPRWRWVRERHPAHPRRRPGEVPGGGHVHSTRPALQTCDAQEEDCRASLSRALADCVTPGEVPASVFSSAKSVSTLWVAVRVM